MSQRCQACGFDWLARWREPAVNVAPPKWWTLPLRYWKPQRYWVRRTLCVRCGATTESVG